MQREKLSKLPVLGWREWLRLPDLGVQRIKAKIDSGARSSSIHAFDLKITEQADGKHVRFKIYPVQRRTTRLVEATAKVLEFREVRSSNGQTELRPVIMTSAQLLGKIWPIELTLTDRAEMGFRMLLGREAFRGRYLVDADSSYLAGKRKRKKKI